MFTHHTDPEHWGLKEKISFHPIAGKKTHFQMSSSSRLKKHLTFVQNFFNPGSSSGSVWCHSLRLLSTIANASLRFSLPLIREGVRKKKNVKSLVFFQTPLGPPPPQLGKRPDFLRVFFRHPEHKTKTFFPLCLPFFPS